MRCFMDRICGDVTPAIFVQKEEGDVNTRAEATGPRAGVIGMEAPSEQPPAEI